MQSISHTLDSAFAGLNELSLYMIANESVRTYLTQPPENTAYSQVNASLQFLPFSSKYYHCVTVFSDGRPALMSGTNVKRSISEEEKKAADGMNGTSFINVADGELSLIQLIRNTNRLDQSLGYLKIQINQNELRTLLSSPKDLPETGYLLLCENGIMLENGSIPATIRSKMTYENLAGLTIDSKEFPLDGKTYSYSVRPIFRNRAVLVSLNDQSSLYRVDSLLITSAVIAILLSAFFIVILVSYYIRWVFNPINSLTKEMTTIEQKNFETDFSVPGNNEISVLSDQFNMMCRRIKQMHVQVYESELKRREAELAILESEINPHFLYNILDTIYWMSEMNHTWKISEMVRSLSNLFRITLHKTADGLMPFSREREYMEGYLTIQQFRYQDQIAFEFYVQDGLDDYLVLKLLLQPIVENAIVHGVEQVGRVVINVYREDADMIYKIYNDGNPVDVEEMRCMMEAAPPDQRGLAVHNIHTRLRMHFGPAYGMTFENVPGGVLVTLRQPAQKNKGGSASD